MFQNKRSQRIRDGLIFPMLLFSLFFISCHRYSENNKTADSTNNQFVAHIRNPDDLKKLDRIETILTVTPEKAVHHPDYQIIEEISVPYAPEYRLSVGDVVEIVYHIRYDEPLENYYLEVQDRISVNFPFHPQFSSSVLVRTDGKVTLPLIGDVHAESKTPELLAKIINEKYAPYLTNPSVTITLEAFNEKIAELKKAITTAPRGQSKIAPITPDGRISFPIIGTLHAEGLSVSKLEKIVNEKYKVFVANLHCNIILLEISQSQLFIFGEVTSPGAYNLTSDKLTLLDALALAGGTLDSAKLKEVVIFRNEGLEKPIAFKVDVESVIRTGNLHPNLRLKPADVVFVPKTRLDEFNDLMAKIFTKGIYTILPFSTNYNWNYRIDGTTGTVP